jgi:hypothetical protein
MVSWPHSFLGSILWECTEEALTSWHPGSEREKGGTRVPISPLRAHLQ